MALKEYKPGTAFSGVESNCCGRGLLSPQIIVLRAGPEASQSSLRR